MDTEGRDYVRSTMPTIGLGTYQIQDEDMLYEVIDAGLEAGYRLIDTAQLYGNEDVIGNILSELLPKHGLTREDIFISTKLSPACQGKEKADNAIDESLDNLETDYLDLLIIHWPGICKMPGTYPHNQRLRKESWEVLEEYYKRGDIRAIGVSNYEIRHLEELFEYCSVLPALNQIEYHPHFHQIDLLKYCKDKGIAFQAYSSLGSVDYREQLWTDSEVKRLATKYSLPVPLFLLSWAISQGISVLPRSTNREHIVANFAAKDVRIEQADINILVENNISNKVCWDPSLVL